ncbi:MAG: Flp pilus assembly complex ATPase component TadA [candidate division Zixibacteria bacterium]|nr:Flp pilus assembly complex ATPase component TadA [candidate division Zixibacteria bacterium]
MVRKKIGDLLVERGHITVEQLQTALADQTSSDKRLGAILVDKGLVTEEQLIDTMAERLSIPRVSLTAMVIDPSVIQRLSVDMARRYTLIPIFAIGNTLTLAMADPLNFIAIDEIKYQTGCEIKRCVATISEITTAIDEYYSVADSLQGIVGHPAEVIDPVPTREQAAETAAEEEAPIVRLVNLIIEKAVKDRASDIHVEPDENQLRIRYRVNGVMREEASPPKSMQKELISRIKIAADLDVSEKRLPQDGRFMARVDGTAIDLRVSTLPTIHGEKIVIRILDPRNVMRSFKALGFKDEVMEAWANVIRKPEGLVLLTGPTSSGKTSTLYATLQDINSIEKNIITVEDPVEYSLPLINQIQINEKAGLNFPSTLRAILRQNPDIIMIGEIRDTETAQMAIRSSLTGHLVFSTLHTNDAPSGVTRLADMGVEKYLVVSALRGVLAQRLVRLNCPNCTEVYLPPEAVLARAGLLKIGQTIEFRRGRGCTQCKGTGFRGMTAIYEFLEVTNAITDLILSDAPLSRIRDAARKQRYLPLFEAGLQDVRNGTICLEELLKETTMIEDYSFTHGQESEQVAHAGSV